MKLSHTKWVILTAALGALAVAGPSPFNPPIARGQVPAFAFLGLVYGWAAGELAWRCVLDPVLRMDVPVERKRRILYATLAVALAAAPLGLLAHRLLAVR